MLYGRETEQGTIDRLLSDAVGGHPGVLVMRGEAGIGKSALLEYAAVTAPARVLRVTGVESETELPFAALHLLLRPVLDHVDALPRQQADALRGVLGVGPATHGDRFLTGLAMLSLLTELSADTPLTCLVDDAHWLDQESVDTLLFAVRRLHAERVAVLFTARDDGGLFPATGVPELRLAGLEPEAAGQLLTEYAGDLALAVRDQIVAEAQGNPLALLELPRTLTPEQRARAFAPLAFSLGGAEPVSSRVLAGFRSRIEALPAAARQCTLVAALDDSGDLGVIIRALNASGGSLADFAPAERAGLLRVTATGVTFRHPLVRSAARLAGDVAQRMAAHRALADAVDDDRRAWHLAAVATGPDERVAVALEEAAVRARRRGGQAAVSAAYERAAELSADPEARTGRWAAAASAAMDAGMPARAEDLTRRAGQAVSRPAVVAELARVRAMLAFQAGRPLDAARLLHDGAEALAATDPVTTLSMLGLASVYTWSSSTHTDQVQLARRTEELTPRVDGPLSAVDAFNRVMRRLLEGDVMAAMTVPLEFGREDSVPFELRVLAVYLGFVRGDIRGMVEAATRLVAECRAEGRVGRMPQAVHLLAAGQLAGGAHPAARASVSEGLRLAEDADQPYWRAYLTGVSAWLTGVAGAEEECREQAAQAAALDGAWMTGVGWATYALVTLDLTMGRHEAVLDRMDRAAGGPARHAFVWSYACPAYIEAAVRVGTPDRAAPSLARFTVWAEAGGQTWALAVLQRCHALLESSAHRYERALGLHRQSEEIFERARTELLFGEWLRRHQRRTEARTHLEAALETFDRIGARPWSARAAAELRATGASLNRRPRAADPLAALTPQELQVVRLAATGASNREIGAQLFLSPRTVAYHLYKAFPKLGVTSRGELAGVVT